jgi:phosphatidylserine/phosphatidylglycerophosphate/cardiolipin synthase-like enzyme
MTQSWSQTRTITQIVSSTVEAPDARSGSKEGVIKNRTVIPGTTAPGWFVNDLKHPQSKDPALANDLKNIEWGPIYAIPWLKNKIEFFVTGSQYFKDVAREMKAAKQCIFIAGWQVNFDVEMGQGETLFEVLRGAVERGVHVFVMPWLAPAPMAFQTGIFETLLALNQLNAGLSEHPARGGAKRHSRRPGAAGVFASPEDGGDRPHHRLYGRHGPGLRPARRRQLRFAGARAQR